MIELSRDIAAFRATIDKTIRGEPDAILLVEFAGDELGAAAREARAARASSWATSGCRAASSRSPTRSWQRDVWEVRKAGLNIMMSMKGDGKPVSFIEDCAVPLEHLAEYTDRLTRVFAKHGTRGTFYAHASVGCLHVRPVLNLRTEHGARQMRAIAEEACALVKEYKGSLLRRARRRARALRVDRADLRRAPHARVRRDQAGVRPEGPDEPRQDRRARRRWTIGSLFRFKPDYRTAPLCARASTGPSTRSARRTAAAASRPPSRCATTTATAASSTRARCARRIA